tara:strand:+ start:65 stop:943 length:879 start_codon:yes stop_codon:yes gene_type:complete
VKSRDLILALSVPLNWALGFTFAKAALAEFPPLMLMGMRFCIAAMILVWFVPRPHGYFKAILLISLVSATLQYGLTFTGLSLIDASLAVIVIHLEVPFAVLLAYVFLREVPGVQRMIGIAVAFAGIALIAGQPDIRGQLFPIALTAAGALMWAMGQIMVKNLDTGVNSFSLIAWVGVFAGPQMLLASLIIEGGQIAAIKNATWIGWGTVLYLGLIMTALGYGIWYRVLSRNPVSQLMPVLLLMPVITIILSVVLLGERPSTVIILGGIIVLVGVAIIVMKRDNPELAKTVPK